MLSFENPVINMKNLSKSFGEHHILKGLDFEIPKNKIVTILGFSGAGKSTLLKHMLGLLQPTAGSISVLGQDLNGLDEDELREFRQNFGMLFQYAALFDSLSTFENVAFPLREFSKMSEAEIAIRVHDLLSSVGLEESSYQKLPSELSGGMRKRVGLARALALNPRIMLYDEPTTGLDPITTKMVNDLIVSMAEKNRSRGMTSVIISHDVRASLQISDFIAFLDRGSIVEYLPASEFAKSDNELVKRFINL